MENKNEQTEKNLIEMVRQKEEADKRLLRTEVVIGVVSSVFFFAMVIIGSLLMNKGEPLWVFLLLFGVGLAQFIVCMLFALKIEQVAGYYECRKCGHRYVPTYGTVSMAMHMGRTRYMKCPECGKWSWQRKVISKEKE